MHSTLYTVYDATKELDTFSYIDTGNSVIINGDKRIICNRDNSKRKRHNNISITPVAKIFR